MNLIENITQSNFSYTYKPDSLKKHNDITRNNRCKKEKRK